MTKAQAIRKALKLEALGVECSVELRGYSGVGDNWSVVLPMQEVSA